MSTAPAAGSSYRPSPLFANSNRASPFRRSGSKLDTQSPSALRGSPTASPAKPSDNRPTTPSRLALAKDRESPFRRSTSSVRSNGDGPTANGDESGYGSAAETPERRPSLGSPFLTTRKTTMSPDPPASPTRPPIQRNITSQTTTTETSTIRAPASPPVTRRAPPQPTPRSTSTTVTFRGGSDPLAHIPPALLHSMRESFSVLDRDNKGTVSAPDVQEALSQVGLDNGPAAISPYFAGQPQSLNLAAYLNMMASLLAPMSREHELLSAFEAFDDQDDGQIDVAELTEALMNTAPEPGQSRLTEREIERVVEGFRGRRALGKKGKGGLGRGDVFRYKEFVGSVCGGGSGKDVNGDATAA
ncbi:putative calmodulin protein [Neofusicoccum parvum UCRNP2]|uniref:Putative calmodulin protein n=1 Tax=Botryosphaeria parva (strain UCR-NP2) TaxID=1287680 RepID=R1EBT3_BOTPV|nr:putative calmodulin protein [Neofusicoccum parvum UCRNP2]